MSCRQVLPANSPDKDVLSVAWADQRIVLARDYDMAELVLRGFARAVGVVIVAFDAIDPATEARRIAVELRVLGDRAAGAVSVIETARVRHRPFDLS